MQMSRFAAPVALAASLCGSASAQTIAHRDISLAMARTIVSGSPGVDDECLQAGLDQVADQLK